MEQDILDIAIDNLSIASNVIAEVIEQDSRYGHLYDGRIKIFIDSFSFELPYSIKRKVTAAHLPFLKEYADNGGLIVFEYAAKSVKEQLRKIGVNYLETSGNAYLAHKNSFIFIDTNKRVRIIDKNSNTAFTKSGLKVIYQLLSDSSSINLSYRDLGELAGVSIDTIGRVYRELVRDQYLVKKDDRNYKISDYDRLFKDWVTLFNQQFSLSVI